MPHLQTYYHFKLDFQNEDHDTGGMWLIHSTKRHKDNQWYKMQSYYRWW